ncbi:hypothetical protein D3C86_1349730 [compost metagenome]
MQGCGCGLVDRQQLVDLGSVQPSKRVLLGHGVSLDTHGSRRLIFTHGFPGTCSSDVGKGLRTDALKPSDQIDPPDLDLEDDVEVFAP